MKTKVVVINDIFTGVNMLIIREEGYEYIKRFSEPVTPGLLDYELADKSISQEDCEIVIVDQDWKNDVRVERV